MIYPTVVRSQDISLYEQVNGRYDFTFVGNTMNSAENNPTNYLVTGTSSTADLYLNPDDTLIKAYLYWAGSGDGDFEVELNGVPIIAERTFSHSTFYDPYTFTYFSAFKDITSIVATTGNGTYKISDLDISPFEMLHYSRKTNFAGWAILIVYQNDTLPLNQLNIYDGLQGVPDNLQIDLTNLYVLDNSGATAGFIAWEGDSQLATETFTVNGVVLSNASNPANNVFNSTSSVTGSNTLYNMDLDIYDIEDYIEIGDTEATITLSSFQDFIMINTVVTKLNSQLPDATIVLNDYQTSCNSGTIELNYTVYNINSTELLPASTPISFYNGSQLIGTSATEFDILIGGNELGSITLNLPADTPETFTLLAVVDDIGNGSGIVIELNENNNSSELLVKQWLSPKFNLVPDLISCNLGFTKAIFNFSRYEEFVKTDSDQTVSFYNSLDDASNKVNEISNITNYEAFTTTKQIFIRIEDEYCYSITSFNLLTKNCPPIIYNFVSANNDNSNDGFFIDGLRDIFVNYKIEIYNRWGKHIWTGDQNKPDWSGYVAEGIGTKKAPAGTYFYILYLNDSDYPKPLTGYLYLTY
ncbi:gliding motility-associated C-terminal domain-containing protein [Flavobacterium ardleyense]|uniref:Gliding motility-associated C-terminal domain-containing protein n=1 Tax=Flavobacterium ardleyense TaxID=2038737 RepID=A0ABW5Z5L0_9FLAO